MKEIRFGDGEAGATSVDSTWVPANAFKFNQPISTGWHTGKRGGPPHTLPVMIWYDLKNDGVIPAEVKKTYTYVHLILGFFSLFFLLCISKAVQDSFAAQQRIQFVL